MKEQNLKKDSVSSLTFIACVNGGRNVPNNKKVISIKQDNAAVQVFLYDNLFEVVPHSLFKQEENEEKEENEADRAPLREL